MFVLGSRPDSPRWKLDFLDKLSVEKTEKNRIIAVSGVVKELSEDSEILWTNAIMM
jgi:hypothetical protein